MKSIRMISLLVSLSLCLFANAQTVQVSEYPESLRQILAHQPDYKATERSFSSASIEGAGEERKMVKLGNRLAEVTEDAIVIKERDKPTLKIFPKRKEYAEVLFQDNFAFADSPETYAAREFLVFKSLGREKVGGYTCIKIEASYPESTDLKFVFWAAPELKGLVVKSEMTYGKYVSFHTLEDISLTVDESIFRIPAGYKKVVEPEL